MADDRIKISELTASNSYSGAYVPGVDSGGETKKFSIASIADIANKVDKVNGKGLSTEDFTTSEKTKLSGIASGAQANVIEVIKVNGVTQTVTNKTVDIIGGGGGGGATYVVADTLPTASADTLNKIYLVPVEQGSSTRNQWLTVEDDGSYSWELIGTTAIDISNCVYLGDVVESNVTIVTT